MSDTKISNKINERRQISRKIVSITDLNLTWNKTRTIIIFKAKTPKHDVIHVRNDVLPYRVMRLPLLAP